MAMVSLGNALIAGSHVLNQSMVGPSTVVVAGNGMAALGSGFLTYIVVSNPKTFEFDRSRIEQYLPTIILVGGVATVFTGILLLTLAVVG